MVIQKHLVFSQMLLILHHLTLLRCPWGRGGTVIMVVLMALRLAMTEARFQCLWWHGNLAATASPNLAGTYWTIGMLIRRVPGVRRKRIITSTSKVHSVMMTLIIRTS